MALIASGKPIELVICRDPRGRRPRSCIFGSVGAKRPANSSGGRHAAGRTLSGRRGAAERPRGRPAPHLAVRRPREPGCRPPATTWPTWSAARRWWWCARPTASWRRSTTSAATAPARWWPTGTGNCGEAFTCRYHGWRYALDGRLRNAVDFGVLPGFDPRQYGLFPIRVETWRGPGVREPRPGRRAAGRAAGAAGRALGRGPVGLPAGRDAHPHASRCNWKTYVENYLEGYHLKMVHPEFDADVVVADYRTEIDGEVIFAHAPARDAVGLRRPLGLAVAEPGGQRLPPRLHDRADDRASARPRPGSTTSTSSTRPTTGELAGDVRVLRPGHRPGPAGLRGGAAQPARPGSTRAACCRRSTRRASPGSRTASPKPTACRGPARLAAAVLLLPGRGTDVAVAGELRR